MAADQGPAPPEAVNPPAAAVPEPAEPAPASEPGPTAESTPSAEPAPTAAPDPPAAEPPAPASAPPAGPAPAPATLPAPPATVAPPAAAPAPRAARTHRRATHRRARLLRRLRQLPAEEDVVCVLTGPDGECLILSNQCDKTGTDGDEQLVSGPAPEVLCGLGGDDVLVGGEGDTLIGGPGDNQLNATTPPSAPGVCGVEGDEVGEGRLEQCEEVATFAEAVEGTREHPVVSGGVAPGVISETAGAGQLYVALTRYLKAGEETAANVLAVILKAVITYDDGEIGFLVRCSYAGDGRVVLTAVAPNHRRVRLGSARFYCSREGDDPAVHVEVSARGRRLVERSHRIQIRALVVDPDRERQPAGARQSFVLRP